MDGYIKLLLSNEAWVKERLQLRKDFFQRAVSEQRPGFLWIGCSDSRVPPEDITGSEPGELFVHRNIANQAAPERDLSLLGVLEYAVAVLHVQHIIVCGHYHCGGVLHAMHHPDDRSTIGQWLEQVKTIHLSHRAVLDRMTDALRFDRLVELNVTAQLRNVARTTIVKKAWATEQRPHLHGWVYDLRTGRLKELETLEAGKDPLT